MNKSGGSISSRTSSDDKKENGKNLKEDAI
jgi:hypothetical protein